MEDRPGVDRMTEVEALIAPEKNEWMAVYSPEGGMLSFKEGGGDKTRMPKHPAILAQFKGATVLHNHPNGKLTPSQWDLDLVRKYGADKVVIVVPGKDGVKRREISKAEAIRLHSKRN